MRRRPEEIGKVESDARKLAPPKPTQLMRRRGFEPLASGPRSRSRARSSPLPPRVLRVAGRGRGGGVYRLCSLGGGLLGLLPPPPTPPPRGAGGGGGGGGGGLSAASSGCELAEAPPPPAPSPPLRGGGEQPL